MDSVRALVGGRSYADSQFNRAVAAKRQPGSAFKAFVYLTALEHGLTPDTVREDKPINVKGWQPENYNHEYFGPVTLTRALAQSLNTVSVRLTLEVTPMAVVRTAYRLGIGSKLEPNASIALGTSEVSMLRTCRRLRVVRQWRLRADAARDRQDHRHQRQSDLRTQRAAARPHHRSPLRRDDERDDGRRR
jgi:membrane peptidoglycan carboxypeptidase